VIAYLRVKDSSNGLSVSSLSSQQLLWIICGFCIQSGCWNEYFLRNSLKNCQNFPHVICPRSILCFTSSTCQPSWCDSGNSLLSLEEYEAVLSKYSLLMNKIKKLKQLESIHCTLIQENQAIMEELELKRQFNPSNLLLNMMDGVELSSSSSSAPSNSIIDELPQYRIFEKSIENHKESEEMFWRWISKPSKDQADVASFNSFSSDIELLAWKKQLEEMLKSFESEVIDGFFKNKADLPAIVDSNASSFTDPHDAFNEKKMSPVSTSVLLEMLPLSSKELLFPSVDERLMSLRENNHIVLSSLVELTNEFSPYDCIVREKPQTF
jgi:hypothetical protein